MTMNNENPHPWLAGPSDPDLAAWEAYLKALRDQLQGDWARAKTAYLALKKVREGLGLPFIDDSIVAETGSHPPGAWTSNEQTQVEDLQAMTTLIVKAFDDVIAGKRKLQWDQKGGFFTIEALPDDLLRLELSANGVPVLVDTKTGQATHVPGSVGIPNFVWVATAATSVLALPAYFVVDAAVNTLTDVAEQRTLQVIANRQFDCVQSGKCTPAEAAALTKAVFDGASGVREAKAKQAAAEGKPTSDLADTAKTLGWVALGLGVLYAVVRLIPAGALGGAGSAKLLPAAPAANPTRTLDFGHGKILVRTDDKWKDFTYGYDVPEKVRRSQFDWLDDAEGSDGFFKYHGTWHHLREFMSTGGYGSDTVGASVLKGWDGVLNTSFSTGILIKVSPDGEQYKVASYRTTSAAA